MKLLPTLLVIPALVVYVSAGTWSVLFNPKVLTAIGASIGIDVVSETWLKSSPDKMLQEIEMKLRSQMNDQLAMALATLKKDDKLPATSEHQYLLYGLLMVGILLAGNLIYLRNHHKKLRRQHQDQAL